MKIRKLVLGILTTGAVILAAASANATIINPAPGTFGNDDAAELFLHSNPTISLQLQNTFAGTFGFYFAGSSATRITIFDATDGAANVAAINFTTGQVLDVDGSILQSVFAPQSGPIGFYLTLNNTTLFSESGLNPGGIDFVATFPALSNPLSYLIGFEAPLGASLVPVAFELVGNLRAVPEPAAHWLFVLGFAAIVAARKNRVQFA